MFFINVSISMANFLHQVASFLTLITKNFIIKTNNIFGKPPLTLIIEESCLVEEIKHSECSNNAKN